MYILYQHHERIGRFICSRSSKAFRCGWIVFLAFMALLAAAFLRIGSPALNGMPWDTPSYLDGAWRILHGQVPHRDFYYYSGDITFYVALLGMKLGLPGIGSILYGNLFVMLLTGFGGMLLLQRRTSAFYTCLFSVFLATLAVTPRALGDSFDYLSYAMTYNRYGEAALALMGIALFLPIDPAARRGPADWAESVFIGICLPILLFCKTNYLTVSAGLIFIACLLRRFSVIHIVVVLLSAAFGFWLAFDLTHIPVSAMRSDYAIMMASQSLITRLPSVAVQAAKGIGPLLLLVLLASEIAGRGSDARPVWKPYFLVALIFGSEVLLVASNAQRGELPLLCLAALYCVDCIRRQSQPETDATPFAAVRNVGGALFLLVFVLPTFGTDLMSMRYAVHRSAPSEYVTAEELRDTPLRDYRFALRGTRYAEMSNYVAWMNEGVELLRRHADPQMRLACFLFANPFHIALDLPPQEGGVVCWSWNWVHRALASAFAADGGQCQLHFGWGGQGRG